ncbi:MAG: DUF1549 domain-containing protein, partial [Planctomycetes bacterium]|nr:DUF1549 domain-containing protein [Planctomycetota bacterium]
MKPAFVTLLLVLITARAQSAELVNYAKQIKPILSNHCYSCHGALKRESGLRLDTAALARAGGDGGPAIVAGQASSSPLLERLVETDVDLRMPLDAPPLTAEQIALIIKWIEQGAKAPPDEQPQLDPRKHWAFQVPKRPHVPAVHKEHPWSTAKPNPIDAFVAARHVDSKLKPLQPTSKNLLLRRVYLDLIGLPPTRKQLHAFLSDDSGDAYRKVVDQLLKSPQYGERWARHWMDVWRYSDWYGRRAVNDVRNSYPHIWRWRDWIIDSLNDDKGYDRMVKEMLAADEIAPEDDNAIAATGFIVRNWFSLNYDQWMKDLVEHTGKAFLGLRFNCAHCHDHKYDPISQREYFAFRAFFEPLEFRHDRVPGGVDLPKYKRYVPGSGASLKPIATGLPRIFDENLEAKTHMYRLGDARDLFDGPPVRPAAPAFLGGDALKIEAIDLPPQAWYPGLKQFIQQEETTKREAQMKTAEAALAKMKEQVAQKLAPLQAAMDEAAKELTRIEKEIAARPEEPQATEPTNTKLMLLANWRFEGNNDDGFLADSSVNGHTLKRVSGSDPPAASSKIGPSGPGSRFFSPLPGSKIENTHAAQFSQRKTVGYLTSSKGAALYANEFTVEAFLHIGVAKSNFNCGIANLQGSWMWLHRGLNANTSEFRMRYFNAAGDVRDFATGSGEKVLTLTTGNDYYVALVMGKDNVTLYARNLTTDGTLESIRFHRNDGDKDFSQLAKPGEDATFTIGNSGNGTGRHQGLLDEVRVTGGVLGAEQIAAHCAVEPVPPQLAAVRAKLAAAQAKLGVASIELRLREAELADARTQLAAVKARIAADNAKHRGAGANSDDLTKAASKAQRETTVATAQAALLRSEKALADAREKAATDKKAQPAVAKAQKQLTSAKQNLVNAQKNLGNTSAGYTPFSPTYPKQSTGRRRALAGWIANNANPLTARVAVNHIWMRHFGEPLVQSVFDFGLSGKSPSHPQLLDWLAVEFMTP